MELPVILSCSGLDALKSAPEIRLVDWMQKSGNLKSVLRLRHFKAIQVKDHSYTL